MALGAMMAVSALQGGLAIMGGKSQKSMYDAQADAIESKNLIIDVKRKITAGRYTAQGSRLLMKSQAAVGASGIKFSGSPIAFILEQQRKIVIDKSIADFNYKIDKNSNTAEAGMTRSRGIFALAKAYGSASSYFLQGAGAGLMSFGSAGIGGGSGFSGAGAGASGAGVGSSSAATYGSGAGVGGGAVGWGLGGSYA